MNQPKQARTPQTKRRELRAYGRTPGSRRFSGPSGRLCVYANRHSFQTPASRRQGPVDQHRYSLDASVRAVQAKLKSRARRDKRTRRRESALVSRAQERQINDGPSRCALCARYRHGDVIDGSDRARGEADRPRKGQSTRRSAKAAAAALFPRGHRTRASRSSSIGRRPNSSI